MSEVEQIVERLTGHDVTVAAIADVLAAIGSEGGLVEWADEQPVAALPPGTPVAASGATTSHGPIRLRDSGPPTLSAGDMPIQQPFVVPPARRSAMAGSGCATPRARRPPRRRARPPPSGSNPSGMVRRGCASRPGRRSPI